jgi:hypothetical protein
MSTKRTRTRTLPLVWSAMMLRAMFGAALLFGIVMWSAPAQAHCDGVDGPVAIAAQRAIETGNVNLALPYAPAAAEAEIVAKFQEARRVRTRGRDARALADRAFVETVVRLHRLGEGASYTGLRPAGLDYGPMIPAAESALDTGDLAVVRAILLEEIDRGLQERLAQVAELRSASLEPASHDGVAAARARVSAELGFIGYAESLRQAVHAADTAGHEE